MTDFTQVVDGSYDYYTLMIRDWGVDTVEFWFTLADPSNQQWGMHFNVTVDGYTQSYTTDIPWGSGWIRIASAIAHYTQYVTFEVVNPNNPPPAGQLSAGLPRSTFTIHVARPTVPYPPLQPYFGAATVNSIDVYWDPNNDGGSTIYNYEIGYGTDSSGPTTIIYGSSGDTVSNLATGTVYYFWIRAQNSVGWSDWSQVNSMRTQLGAYVMYGGVWRLAIPYVNFAGSWLQAEPIVIQL